MVYVFRTIVCYNGCILSYGVWGGSSGTIYRLIYMGADYDDGIAEGMNYSLWLQINRSHPTTDF